VASRTQPRPLCSSTSTATRAFTQRSKPRFGADLAEGGGGRCGGSGLPPSFRPTRREIGVTACQAVSVGRKVPGGRAADPFGTQRSGVQISPTRLQLSAISNSSSESLPRPLPPHQLLAPAIRLHEGHEAVQAGACAADETTRRVAQHIIPTVVVEAVMAAIGDSRSRSGLRQAEFAHPSSDELLNQTLGGRLVDCELQRPL
jgi:hypothetical protein